MTANESASEDVRRKKLDALTLAACNGQLLSAITRSGGELRGFSVRLDDFDVLLTLRANFPGGRMIAFVGGEDVAGCLRKAVRHGLSDGLQWRVDKYG